MVEELKEELYTPLIHDHAGMYMIFHVAITITTPASSSYFSSVTLRLALIIMITYCNHNSVIQIYVISYVSSGYNILAINYACIKISLLPLSHNACTYPTHAN